MMLRIWNPTFRTMLKIGGGSTLQMNFKPSLQVTRSLITNLSKTCRLNFPHKPKKGNDRSLLYQFICKKIEFIVHF